MIVEHLAGAVSLEEMLAARGPHGERVCVLDWCELDALRRVMEARGEHEIASDLADVLRHVPADLVGWRRLILVRAPSERLLPGSGCLLVGAISRSLPTVDFDFWIACGTHDDAVMVTALAEQLSPELSVRGWAVYRDGAAVEDVLAVRGG